MSHRLSFRVAVYQVCTGAQWEWTTLGTSPHVVTRSGASAVRAQQALVERLRAVLEGLPPLELARFEPARGLELRRVRLELSLDGERLGRRAHIGAHPLVLEPRWATPEHRVTLVYHPLRQHEWFALDPERPLEDQARVFFASRWADLSDEELEVLTTDGKDSITSMSFSTKVTSLLDGIPERERDPFADLDLDSMVDARGKKKRGGLRVLPRIGTNLTVRAAEGTLATGMPRSPHREQLQRLLCAPRKQSTLVVGAPGVGKSTLVDRAIVDLLDAEGWSAHRNLDRVTEVWSISARRTIAGMSHLGEWEKRCMEVLADCRARPVVLRVEDLHTFGRAGRHTGSDRSFADVFRGPLARGEIVMIGEVTPEQLQRLEDDAPGFAELFQRVLVHEPPVDVVLRMMFHEARRLEHERRVRFAPLAYRAILDLGGGLSPGRAFPGKALDLLRAVGRAPERPDDPPRAVGPADVVAELARRTGLPASLVQPDAPLDPADVEAFFARDVMGQPAAVRAAVDLAMRIRAGLVDPRRPYGVYLLTGPTGTGKTELARAIARWLYGGEQRLVRIDMGELGHPGAVARLIGDAWDPEGMLTRRVREQPFCVVLLDEIEKAHPAVLQLLLQLLDEGRLTDAAGITADFTHTVVLMTSNLGGRSGAAIGFDPSVQGQRLDVLRAVREFFPPELFNRIDRVVPFDPLSLEVAERVAEKELSKLLARRGLAERGVYVFANERAVTRIAHEAFDVQGGARSVKRWLEDRVGSLLAEEIAGGPRGRMRIVRLASDASGFSARTDPLVEADPVLAEHPMAALLDRPAIELEPLLPDVLDEVHTIEERGLLEERTAQLMQRRRALSGEARAELDEVLHAVERVRDRLAALRIRLEGSTASEEDRWDRYEDEHDLAAPSARATKSRRRHHDQPGKSGDSRVRERVAERALDRAGMLEVITERDLLRRAVLRADDPRQHTVAIELLRVGRARRERSASLLSALLGVYLAPPTDHATISALVHDAPRTVQPTEAQGADHVIVVASGLCILDRLEEESGCHVWHSLGGHSEVVRVSITPVRAGTDPRVLLRDHLDTRRAFEHALEAGISPLPPDPAALLPVVRVLRFDPPVRTGESALAEIEDLRLAWAASFEARDMITALARALPIRASREEVAR
ncbi:AAA family ATPase [Sandaracinus amylolyticus]|uniref:AAA family ATPase n=1 Tax=Sandaracinus amylolyticus TaxID=927083 RepID=UPI001F020CCD|nr:AAA family ATPase [Sandaracinus amylolyticus]UJR79667.1 ATP-dependent Clp protease ATP-binding subunit ClpA [Sandaracinus amylolyticus]